ncbi:MAG TPA: hypothetical protein DCY74_09285, partial [Clostridiales bacterium]|nr:hypothetical protein [Clostridiales bacterium]
ALKTVQNGRGAMPHMPLTGSSSFDLYEKKEGQYTYQKTFIAPVHMTDGYENIFYCNRTDLRDYTLNFPLYHGVNALYIGLHKESVLDAGDRYIHEKPIVYYGSSITQGGCASRPGNAYQAHITRWFDTDHINLGFSGNGKGEKSMADWMASLDMGVFVSDYDFNAPTAEHLEATHKPLYETIRTAHPDIPYIILSRPNLTKKTIQTDARHAIIQKTYVDARAAGDKNVYFIPGNELFGEVDRDVCTVDTTHPTDEGFYRMAQRMARVIKHLDW